MKKCGDQYTVRGQLTHNTTNNRIVLFDGRFDTGYVIEKIEISSRNPTDGDECQLKVKTESGSETLAYWNWSSNTEIAWASWGTPVGTRWGYTSIVDPDHIVVEDLYLDVYTTNDPGEPINYMMTMQKYEFPEWSGALAMVRNRSQG